VFFAHHVDPGLVPGLESKAERFIVCHDPYILFSKTLFSFERCSSFQMESVSFYWSTRSDVLVDGSRCMSAVIGQED
jgi:hypothetical protein